MHIELLKPHLRLVALLAVGAVITSTCIRTTTVAVAAPPHGDFTGIVVHVPDADTFVVKRRDGSEVKVRLHWADAPEVAHNSKEVNQPGGIEAKAWAQDYVLRKRVTVKPHSLSYGRIVGDVIPSDRPNVGLAAVISGHAWLDPRYKPRADWLMALEDAKKFKSGLWAEDKPIPPWEWRKMTREEQRKHK